MNVRCLPWHSDALAGQHFILFLTLLKLMARVILENPLKKFFLVGKKRLLENFSVGYPKRLIFVDVIYVVEK